MSFSGLFKLNSLTNCSKSSKLFYYNKILYSCLGIIQNYGYISSFKEKIVNNLRFIEVTIRLDEFTKKNILNVVKFISTPSCKRYFNCKQLSKIYLKNKNKLFIVSTSFIDKNSSTGGIMSIEDAIRHKVGGELLCEIF